MSKPVKMTYSIAMAAAQDAGNRSMRAGGRTKWAVQDWNIACQTFERLYGTSTVTETRESSNPYHEPDQRLKTSHAARRGPLQGP